ncbi:MAG: DNA replication and repair protein RecF [Crocinitomicaceae bacterium]|nr:DNA replication and repair protein RecF [Crocinitomicaceae bacterium]
MTANITIHKLSLYNFKCYIEGTFEFNERIVCLLGENGSGKTNLLDAIHYLCFSKSYFNSIDFQNITFGEDQTSISGVFSRGEYPEEIICAIRKNQRKIVKRNHKEYDRLADHIGLLPLVMITPYDSELILDGSEVRRKFLDATISQSSSRYLHQLVAYNHALQQRNNLLKQFSGKSSDITEFIEPWDMQLAQLGNHIFEERKRFFATFLPLFEEIYTAISGKKELPGISYDSDLEIDNMEHLLLKNRDRDRMLERTTAGIHRDELVFTLDGQPLKKFASQGQQKSFLIALKLAQCQFLRDIKHFSPILLLDDLFDKVDESRVTNLLHWIGNHHQGQVFITDTDLHRIPVLLNSLGLSGESWKIERNLAATRINEFVTE